MLGLPGLAPFDRILVSAMADSLPDGLIAQLAPGGIMVAPADGEMYRVRKGRGTGADGADDGTGAGAEDITITAHGAYRFVPLL